MKLIKLNLLIPFLILTVKAKNEESDYDDTFPLNRNPRFITQLNTTDNSTLIIGVGSGTHRMKPNQVIRIHSEHYGVSDYFHEESSWWSFKGDGCGVSVTCPCFDVPSSFKCLGDFLKIADLPYYHQRFCGTVKPQGIYRSGSGDMSLRFRVDKRETGKGFLCYASCTEVGKADPGIPVIKPEDCFKALPPISSKVQTENIEIEEVEQPNPGQNTKTKCLTGEIEVGGECYVLKTKNKVGESSVGKVVEAVPAQAHQVQNKLIESDLIPVGERG